MQRRKIIPSRLFGAVVIVLANAMPLVVSAQESTLLSSGVIFESDFSLDTNYFLPGNSGLWNGGTVTPVLPPNGWDAVKGGEGDLEVLAGEGIAGSNALKIRWSPDFTQPTVSLAKHLSGDESQGFNELYIRYRVRLPEKFMVGAPGKSINHWKWGRLWQNTSVDNTLPNKWTELRANSGYVVWNFSGNVPYTMATATWSENSGPKLEFGSSGGARQKLDYFISGSDRRTAPGYFESLWPFDEDSRRLLDADQSWQTIEWRFKLATTENSDDGVFEMWWNGVNQGEYARILKNGGAPNRSGIPTTTLDSGFNFFTFFDNLSGWNKSWADQDVDGHILVSDVVVSTSPIGISYDVGDQQDSDHVPGECRAISNG